MQRNLCVDNDVFGEAVRWSTLPFPQDDDASIVDHTGKDAREVVATSYNFLCSLLMTQSLKCDGIMATKNE